MGPFDVVRRELWETCTSGICSPGLCFTHLSFAAFILNLLAIVLRVIIFLIALDSLAGFLYVKYCLSPLFGTRLQCLSPGKQILMDSWCS